MDGNRRWAKKKLLMPWLGHKSGINPIKSVLEFCIEKKIKYISLYAFSLENFKRSEKELKFFFQLFIEESDKALPDLIKEKVRIRFCGDTNLFPSNIKSKVQKLENKTKNFDKLYLNIIFCYGGQQEIISAAKNIAHDVKTGKIEPNHIDKQLFDSYLWTSNIPEPDLIIRTGGQMRLSNFLLFKAAYSELLFTKKLWPDFTKADLEKAYDNFIYRKRNLGK